MKHLIRLINGPQSRRFKIHDAKVLARIVSSAFHLTPDQFVMGPTTCVAHLCIHMLDGGLQQYTVTVHLYYITGKGQGYYFLIWVAPHKWGP